MCTRAVYAHTYSVTRTTSPNPFRFDSNVTKSLSADYSRYDMTIFTEEEKRAHRDAHFETDLANARALGKRLVEKSSRTE